jgi:hypothetical protein
LGVSTFASFLSPPAESEDRLSSVDNEDDIVAPIILLSTSCRFLLLGPAVPLTERLDSADPGNVDDTLEATEEGILCDLVAVALVNRLDLLSR